jgi:hypothetical protein
MREIVAGCCFRVCNVAFDWKRTNL